MAPRPEKSPRPNIMDRYWFIFSDHLLISKRSTVTTTAETSSLDPDKNPVSNSRELEIETPEYKLKDPSSF